MYKQVDKTKENNSRAVANSVGQKKSGAKQGFGFVDNRSETKAQINFQKMVNNNQLLEQEAQVGVMDDNYATQQLKFIQNKSNFSLANNN